MSFHKIFKKVIYYYLKNYMDTLFMLLFHPIFM